MRDIALSVAKESMKQEAAVARAEVLAGLSALAVKFTMPRMGWDEIRAEAGRTYGRALTREELA